MGIYDAKLAYCKRKLIEAIRSPAFLPGTTTNTTKDMTPLYLKWYTCNKEWGVEYDE